MIVIFSTMNVRPEQRPRLDAEMADYLQRTALARRGAAVYEYMADPADDSRVHVFQTWTSDADFQAWTQNTEFAAMLSRYKQDDSLEAVKATVFENCTGMRDGPV